MIHGVLLDWVWLLICLFGDYSSFFIVIAQDFDFDVLALGDRICAIII